MKTSKYLFKNDLTFFERVAPVKITESKNLNMNLKCWSLLSDFYIESVKINSYKPGQVTSSAVIKVSDISGQVTCVVKSSAIGLLFGLTHEEWSNIENMCNYKQQLFYRYFKDGLSKNFGCEQKLFYDFCKSNQTQEVLTAIYCRCPNFRNKDKDDAIVQIFDLIKTNNHIMKLYTDNLRVLI